MPPNPNYARWSTAACGPEPCARGRGFSHHETSTPLIREFYVSPLILFNYHYPSHKSSPPRRRPRPSLPTTVANFSASGYVDPLSVEYTNISPLSSHNGLTQHTSLFRSDNIFATFSRTRFFSGELFDVLAELCIISPTPSKLAAWKVALSLCAKLAAANSSISRGGGSLCCHSRTPSPIQPQFSCSPVSAKKSRLGFSFTSYMNFPSQQAFMVFRTPPRVTADRYTGCNRCAGSCR